MLNAGFTWAGKGPEYIVLICAVLKTRQPDDVTTCEGEGQRSIAFQDSTKAKRSSIELLEVDKQK